MHRQPLGGEFRKPRLSGKTRSFLRSAGLRSRVNMRRPDALPPLPSAPRMQQGSRQTDPQLRMAESGQELLHRYLFSSRQSAAASTVSTQESDAALQEVIASASRVKVATVRQHNKRPKRMKKPRQAFRRPDGKGVQRAAASVGSRPEMVFAVLREVDRSIQELEPYQKFKDLVDFYDSNPSCLFDGYGQCDFRLKIEKLFKDSSFLDNIERFRQMLNRHSDIDKEQLKPWFRAYQSVRKIYPQIFTQERLEFKLTCLDRQFAFLPSWKRFLKLK